MDFLKKFAESTTETKTDTTDKSAPSTEENSLFSSAKLVADAARSTYQNDPEKKYDNAEVAGAAADLLDAAQTYGKLDKTSGVGGYVEKAETYLHEYETSHSTKPKPSEEPKPSSEKEEEAAAKPTTEEPKPSTEDKEEPVSEEPKPSSEKEEVEEPREPAAKPTTDSEEKTSGGLGDYSKIAEGFLKKDEESAEGEKGEAGIGQYAKLAEGFLKKPSDTEGSKSSDAGGDLMKLAGGFFGKN